MTVKPVYIPTILLPHIVCHYVDAAFLLKPLKSTAPYSVIDVNNEVKLKLTEYNQPDSKESLLVQ